METAPTRHGSGIASSPGQPFSSRCHSQRPVTGVGWAGPRGFVAGPLLRKVGCLVPVQSMGKEPPLMGSTWPSRPPTSEPRSAHICLFQELNAQTLSLPPLPKHVRFAVSQEGSLEGWPDQCFRGRGAEGALKFDLPGDPAWPRHSLYCKTQTQVRKMAMLGQGMCRAGRP